MNHFNRLSAARSKSQNSTPCKGRLGLISLVGAQSVQSSLAESVRLATALALTVCFVAACSSAPSKRAKRSTLPVIETAATETPSAEFAGEQPSVVRGPLVVKGSGQFLDEIVEEAPLEAGAAGESVQLSFTDTDIRQVVSVVLAETLGYSVTIDPAVKGTLTLQSDQPLSKRDLFKTLESALRLQDIVIIGSGKSFVVTPAANALRQSGGVRKPSKTGAPGFGVEVLQLRYIAASDMEKLLTPFSPPGSILRVDESRNLLLIAGTGPELAAIRETVRTFDVNWLSGMSYALYPVEFVDAKTIVAELKDIVAEDKGPMKGVLRMVPLSRLNMVLVAAQQPEYLEQVESWIRRLDLGSSTPGRRIYVYDVQNGRAADLAATLNEMFGLSSSSSNSTSPGSSPSFRRPGSLGSFSSNLTNDYSPGFGTAGQGLSGLGSGGLEAAANENLISNRGSRDGSSGAAISLENLGLRVVTSEETNALLIFASPAEFGALNAAIKQLDIAPRQVLIEATFAEVTLTDEIKFGIEWLFRSGGQFANFSSSASGGINSLFPGLSYVYSGSSSVQAVLNALESITDVKVISSPQLMVLNNREARIQVGDQVPILTQQAVSTSQPGAPIVNSVAQRDTGVILRVTPRVNKSGVVTLEIAQEVSAVVPTTTSTIDSPTIQERSISSTVSVRDGSTIALGGLIRESDSNSRAGLPLLARIPLLGWLFGATNKVRDRTELVVLITPRVVRDDEELYRLMQDMNDQFKQTIPKVVKPPFAKP